MWTTFLDPVLQLASKAAGWDESQHPRHPKGSDKGGEFAPKGGEQDDILDFIEDDEELDTTELEQKFAKWQRGLSSREKHALLLYRDRGRARDINDYLRGGSEHGMRDVVRHLDAALERGRIPDGQVLWRGTLLSPENRDWLDGLSSQATTTFSEFLSASPSSSIAGNFAVRQSEDDTPVLFKLTARGAKGAYISAPGREPEFLLQRGARLSVSGVQELSSGLIIIEGTVDHRAG